MTYIDVLREKRREVVAEIDGLRAEAAAVATRLTAKEGQLRNLDDLLALEGKSSETRSPEESPSRSASTTSRRFTDAAVEVLAERGEPIHYQELARILGERQIYVPGKDPAANLIAHMLRDPRFTRTGGRGMYGLATWGGPVARPRQQPKRARVQPPRARGRVV